MAGPGRRAHRQSRELPHAVRLGLPAGAIAEAIGNHAIWTPQLLQGRRDLSGSVRAIAELDAGKVDVLNLDDPRELVRRHLRPSTVVIRDRTVTQRWALDIFNEKRWAGTRWWSRYDSRWGAFGLWTLAEVRSLKVTRPATTWIETVRISARSGQLEVGH